MEALARLTSERGVPAFIRTDIGPEFVSMAVLPWQTESEVETVQIDLGKRWQNGTNESFNGCLRDECLNFEWFRTPREAHILIEARHYHYNAVRTQQQFSQQLRTLPPIPDRATSQEAVVRNSWGRSIDTAVALEDRRGCRSAPAGLHHGQMPAHLVVR